MEWPLGLRSSRLIERSHPGSFMLMRPEIAAEVAGLLSPLRWSQIVVHDLSEPERKVRKDVDCRDDLENRQLGDGGQRVSGEL